MKSSTVREALCQINNEKFDSDSLKMQFEEQPLKVF
jgi:hypothetical protein